jgi:putative transposase
MLKSFKYSINPTKEQQELIAKSFGCARFVYNWGLNLKTENYSKGIKLTCFDTINQMAILKKELVWLREAHSQIPQMSLRNLDNAYTKFFKKIGKFPKFKSKRNKQSFQYPQGVKVDFDNQKVSLPKIGKINAVLHRKFEGVVKTTTVSMTPNGKYFVSILVDTKEAMPDKINITSENQAVGIDLGIKSFLTMSNGIEIANPRHLKNKEARLAVKQQRLSRKAKKSNLRNKARLEVAKVHSKISNSRKDFHHKLSRAIVNKYDCICLEDLAVSDMVQNHKLAKAISDVGWGQFVSFLEYKAEWAGKTTVKIGRFQASSQPCISCGKLNPLVKNLAVRNWVCPNCSHYNYRDLTASKNILKFGLIQLGGKGLSPSINKSILSGEPLVMSITDFAKFER